jgi:2-keto-4-pentenoate hydratase
VTVAATRAAVERLTAANLSGVPCSPVRDILGSDDLSVAYEVQQEMVAARISGGQAIAGHKIGLTNQAVQAQLGVDQPDFGVLLDAMDCSRSDPIDIGRLLQPRIEGEIAFVLGADLGGDEPIDLATVRASVAYASPALEIVDSRIVGWDISIVDTIADNASSGLYVLGSNRTPLSDFDPVEVTMHLRRGSEVVSQGSGADCLGDPLAAVAWLAETVRRLGRPLRAGEVILSGALGPMVPVAPGDTFVAELGPLGSVRTRFSTTSAIDRARGAR